MAQDALSDIHTFLAINARVSSGTTTTYNDF